MSKIYSGRIHDPNHSVHEYDLYFNDDLISGNGYFYTMQELADVLGSSQTLSDPAVVDNALPLYPVQMLTELADEITIKHWNKNMMPKYMSEVAAYPEAQQANVTATVNDDGSITINGTPTAQTDFYLQANHDGLTDIFDGVSITISGCPAGGGASTYRMQVCQTSTSYGNDDGSGYTVTGRTNTRFRIRIAANYTCNNLTFYPMVRLASFVDATYVKPEYEEFTFKPIETTAPVDIMDYAPIQLYDGENVISSSSGDVALEYIQK